MREANVSLPSRNQAASTITHALYDRRALDCTSTLPLCNSLNSLAYLTTSSARIREILTRDGGLERLVTILKKGRCRTPHESMMWYYALQCVVNIGVRGADAKSQDSSGSESIRTRVVQADIVPVVATLLDNYLQGIDRLREAGQFLQEPHLCGSRLRAAPPRIDTNAAAPPPPPQISEIMPAADEVVNSGDMTPTVLSSPVDQTIFTGLNFPQRDQERTGRTGFQPSHQYSHSAPSNTTHTVSSQMEFSRPGPSITRAAIEDESESQDAPNSQMFRSQVVLPSRDLVPPPMTAGYRTDGLTSHPQSPTTPTGPMPSSRGLDAAIAEVPTNLQALQPEPSVSGDSDEEAVTAADEVSVINPEDSTADLDGAMDVDVREAAPSATEVVESTPNMADPDVSNDEYNETFSIRHLSVDGQLTDPTADQINTALPPANPTPVDANNLQDNSLAFAPIVTPPFLVDTLAQRAQFNTPHQADTLSWMPRAEHIVLSLQLLAYVSKYCQLRSYFQQCHLVPALRPESLRRTRAEDIWLPEEEDEDIDNEYCIPDDYNIFPLVEKFTVKQYSKDMKYWACVVMRNLCRKDKTKGDIRQCAYYKCGKWEEYARQFAKCRRCRQTKYCSKECQKSAWVFHRHWCEPAKENKDSYHRQHQAAPPPPPPLPEVGTY